MIPISLKIQGLFSYQDDNYIDFRPLTAAGLFGIFGRVGSGKSSILDAISLALYGESDRLSGREKRNYNIMNLQSQKLEIEFRFSHQDEEYLFCVKGSRNSRRFEDVKNLDRSAYRLQGEEWKALHDRSKQVNGDDILGISYKNFRRAIVIPQGKFQEFLQLKPTERRNMMSELFRLERFDLSDASSELLKEAHSRLDTLSGTLGELELINDELLGDLKKELKELSSKETEIQGSLDKLGRQVSQLDSLHQLHLDLEKAEAERQRIERQAREMEVREEKLARYESCVADFQGPLQRLDERSEEYRSAAENLRMNRRRAAEVEQAKKRLQGDLDFLRPKYEKRDQLKNWMDEAAILDELRGNEQKLEEISGAINDLKEAEAVNQEQILALEKKDAELKAGIGELQEKSALLDDSAEISEWYAEKRNIQRRLEEQNQQLKISTSDGHQRYREFCENIDNFLEKTGDLKFESLAPDLSGKLEDLLKNLKDRTEHPEHERLGKFFEPLQSDVDDLRGLQNEKVGQEDVRKVFALYSTALQDGEACPLCGSTHHPMPFQSDGSLQPDLFSQAALRDDAQEELDNAKQLQEALIQYRSVLDSNHIYLRDAVEKEEEAAAKVHALQEELKRHLNKFSWKNFDPKNEAEYQARFTAAREAAAERRSLETQFRSNEKLLNGVKGRQETLRGKLGAAEKEKAIYEERSKALRARISDHVLDEYSSLSKKELDDVVEQLDKEYRQLEKQYRRLEEDVRETSGELDGIRGTLGTQREHLCSLQGIISSTAREIAELLPESGFAGINEVRSLLAEKLNLPEERAALQDYRQRQVHNREALQDLRAKIESFDMEYSEEAHRDLQQQKKDYEQKRSELLERKGRLREKVGSVEASLEKKKRLQKEKSELEKRISNLNILAGLFKGKGFINFVATKYLQDLCEQANKRFFPLTHKQLRLEMNSENDFVIRDFLNGGRLRSVKTLSGGQLFQASFSLALALADSIHQNEEGFFFLDEGFGSLDRNALQEVFGTLKSLRREKRIVGIISHVEQLRDEVPVFLQVTNTEKRGSLVSPHWQ